VVRTAVGEANVVEAMRRERALLGGEGNGGVIWPEVVHVRDSLGGAALLLELLATTARPLSQLVADLPAYAILKDKADVSPEVLQGMAGALRSRFAQQAIDTQDGVRVDWPDRWVHVRASNTEPIIRVIAEAPRETDAKALISQVRQAIGLS
jgi:phosphomannomutase